MTSKTNIVITEGAHQGREGYILGTVWSGKQGDPTRFEIVFTDNNQRMFASVNCRLLSFDGDGKVVDTERIELLESQFKII